MFVEKLVDTDIERIINDLKSIENLEPVKRVVDSYSYIITEMKRRMKYMQEILQKRLSGVKESLMENAKNIFL